MIDETKKRMGIEGTGYGRKTGALIDAVVRECSRCDRNDEGVSAIDQFLSGGLISPEKNPEMSREDWLRLAWACVDQASCMRTLRLAQRAQEAIEDLYDAEPETLREGTIPEQVKLSDAERGMLLEMPMTLLEVKDGDANLLRPLVFKGLITCEAGTWVLTEAGRAEVRKWGS